MVESGVRNCSVEIPQELNTESDITVPTTVPTVPSPASIESPTADSGATATEETLSDTPPETSETGVEQSDKGNTKTYPTRTQNQCKA